MTGARLAGWGALLLAAPLSWSGPAEARSAQASLLGTTGLLNIPTADVTPEGSFRIGYNYIDPDWAYVERDSGSNEVIFFTVGFLPRLEVSIRATVFTETDFLIEGQRTAADRAISARVRLLDEGWWPAVAVGIDDPRGTKRTHALYAVGTKRVFGAGQTLDISATGGYASTAIEASRYLLDGGFGGLECQIRERMTFGLEYDSEKWNTGARVAVLPGVVVQAVLLDMDGLSGGISWTKGF
jgi:hypothetical protein